MRISVVGAGYVGLVAGACLANFGNEVICIDVDSLKIDSLKKGIIPIYEPGLKELVALNTKEERLSFTTDIKHGVESAEIIFIAVGTPEGEDGSADLSHVLAAAADIGKYMDGYKIIVNKSTVPVKTADLVRKKVRESQKNPIDFDVVSNPEFLREGSAIKDFTSPDRVIIGADTEKARSVMHRIYRNMERTGHPIIFTDVTSAELIKYASNGMLATRISFMNQLSHLCETTGADVKLVAKGMGLDKRIGPRFLQAGIGYGGSCFPKDVQALIKTLKQQGCEADILEAVERVNDRQKLFLAEKLKAAMPSLEGKKIAVWGLSFKPKTDDMREAPAIVIIDALNKAGCEVHAFDPVAMKSAERVLINVKYGSNPYDVLKDADALLVLTEWDEFRAPDFDRMKLLMSGRIILDGRNIYDPGEVRDAGFKYFGVGR